MIGLLGICYKTASINIRERFSFTKDEIIEFQNLLKLDPNLQGVVVLSTCNRTEIYFNHDKCCVDGGLSFIKRNLTYFKKYSVDYEQYFYFKHGEKAVEHLFKVTTGLESLIIGEDQVIKQVKDAFIISEENNAAGRVITRMFHKAFETGKRVRTETTINKGNVSVSSAAIKKCSTIFSDLSKKSVLIIGAGQTGELAMQNLYKRGCENLFLINRTYSKAIEIVKKYDATAVEFNDLQEYLELCDVIIVATGSKSHLIIQEIAEKASNKRHNTKQLYIDLSVPRNIEESIKDIENVELFAVDDLQEMVQITTKKRQEAVVDAFAIIAEIIGEFNNWLNTLNLTPTIKQIKENFHNINNSELEGFMKIYKVKSKDEVKNYAEHITEKYTRLLIRNLKTVTDNGKRQEYLELINNLFEMA